MSLLLRAIFHGCGVALKLCICKVGNNLGYIANTALKYICACLWLDDSGTFFPTNMFQPLTFSKAKEGVTDISRCHVSQNNIILHLRYCFEWECDEISAYSWSLVVVLLVCLMCIFIEILFQKDDKSNCMYHHCLAQELTCVIVLEVNCVINVANQATPQSTSFAWTGRWRFLCLWAPSVFFCLAGGAPLAVSTPLWWLHGRTAPSDLSYCDSALLSAAALISSLPVGPVTLSNRLERRCRGRRPRPRSGF